MNFIDKTLNYKLKTNYLMFFLFSLSFIPYWFFKSKIIDLNGGCGNDGLTYCSMALGNIEFAPFSRRTFLPGLIHILQIQNVLYAFYILNIVFILLTFYIMYLLTKKVCNKYILLILGLVVLNPHILRWLFAYPVMTDFLGLLLILSFIYFNVSIEKNNKYFILASILIILCFVRENAPLTLTIGYTIWALLTRKNIFENFILFVISAIFTFISFQQPSTINTVQETDVFVIAKQQLQYFTDNQNHFLLFVFFIVFGFSIYSLFGMFIIPKKNNPLGGLYVTSIIMVISAPLLGGEARHFVIPGILMLIYFFCTNKNQKLVLPLSIVQLSFWYLGAYADGSIESFMILFGQRFSEFESTWNLIRTAGIQVLIATPICYGYKYFLAKRLPNKSLVQMDK